MGSEGAGSTEDCNLDSQTGMDSAQPPKQEVPAKQVVTPRAQTHIMPEKEGSDSQGAASGRLFSIHEALQVCSDLASVPSKVSLMRNFGDPRLAMTLDPI